MKTLRKYRKRKEKPEICVAVTRDEPAVTYQLEANNLKTCRWLNNNNNNFNELQLFHKFEY